jgi:hypothetical protein
MRGTLTVPEDWFGDVSQDLSAEHELLDDRTSATRRDPTLAIEDTLTHALRARLEWVTHGATALDRVQLRVSKLLVEAKAAARRPRLQAAANELSLLRGQEASVGGARSKLSASAS